MPTSTALPVPARQARSGRPRRAPRWLAAAATLAVATGAAVPAAADRTDHDVRREGRAGAAHHDGRKPAAGHDGDHRPAPPVGADTAAFETAFMTAMIDHHAMAVHMADMCVEKAVQRKVRKLCRSIAAGQAAEIAKMRQWLSDWYGVAHEPAMSDPAHHAQMTELASLSGEAFEARFLALMIDHHRPAVTDGAECVAKAGHGELRRLCKRIVQSQQREIKQMRRWLCRWYDQCAPAAPRHS